MVRVAVRREGRLDLEVWTPAASRQVGQAIADQIRTRTAAGINAEGVPFGRHPDGQPIDLRDTGRMLDSLGVKEASATGAIVDTDVPYDDQPGRLVFMGLAPNDIPTIERAVQAAADEALATSARESGTPTIAGGRR